MTDESASALSITEAVAALQPQPSPQGTAGEEREEEESPAEDLAEEATSDQGEEDAAEGDEPSKDADEADEADEDDAEAQGEPIEAPSSWPDEDKAAFAQLPKALQETISKREEQREQAVRLSQQRAADARKAFEGRAGRIDQLVTVATEAVQRAAEVFELEEWAETDWQQWIETDPTRAMQGKLRFEAQQQELQRLNALRMAATEEQERIFAEAEAAKVPDVVPDLVDPEKGVERLRGVVEMLAQEGINPRQLKTISATELKIAYEAWCWRKLQARPKPKPVITKPKAAGPALRPSSAPQAPTRTRTARDIEARLAKSGSVDDAIAVLKARGIG